MRFTGLDATPGAGSRTAAVCWIFAVLALAACQPVPQPSWSPSLEPSSGWVREEETPTPVPHRPPQVQEAAYVPGSPLDGGRAPIRGDLGAIRFEQDREVWTIGWVALPRSGRAYPVMHLKAKLSGTVQAELLWDRPADDFALEALLPDGSFQSASRSGQKESTRLFLRAGARTTVYLTRFSNSDTAPKLVLRFSAGSALQEEEPVAAEPEPSEAPPIRFSELDLPPPLSGEPAEEAPAGPPPTEPPPVLAAVPPTPRPVRTAARWSPPPTARKTRTQKATAKPKSPSRKAPRAEQRVPARAKARPLQPTPTAVPAATAAAVPTLQAGADQAVVGQPQKGMRISPRGEAARVQLGAEEDSLAGRQSIVLDIPEARLEITVPRGFEVNVTDDGGRRIPLVRGRLFEVWEGIPGTEHSFLSDTHSTRPLRSGRYSVEVRGPLGSVRFRAAKGSFAGSDLAARYRAQLVLIKRLR